MKFFFASQLDVTERVAAHQEIAAQKALVDHEVQRRTAELEAALEAKTLLLHEVDHRVKNNLTMVGALLRLQARTLDDSAMAAKLETMMERIDALATVHRRLYQSSDVTRFDLTAFAVTSRGRRHRRQRPHRYRLPLRRARDRGQGRSCLVAGADPERDPDQCHQAWPRRRSPRLHPA